MLDAARSKASRGELRLSVPFGYVWHRELGLGFDPDLRLQEVIRLIFARFRELGSARQVLLSMMADQIHFPRPSDEGRMTNFEWMPIRYRNVTAILNNPFYAGVYVYGKSEKRTSIVDGRARRSYRHRKPYGTWEVMIKDHHESYISWDEFERNQKQLALNNYGRAGGVKTGRGGRALLSGIMTCGRCGPMATVMNSSPRRAFCRRQVRVPVVGSPSPSACRKILSGGFSPLLQLFGGHALKKKALSHPIEVSNHFSREQPLDLHHFRDALGRSSLSICLPPEPMGHLERTLVFSSEGSC
jgi:hypothetical protein